MDASMVIDVTVIALLGATIFYAFRLERKLEGLRMAQTAFADVVRDLNMAAARAEAGIRGLKAAAESSGQSLDEKTKRARSVGDELGLLLQAGQRSAQKADGMRTSVPPTHRPQATPAGDALRALGGMR